MSKQRDFKEWFDAVWLGDGEQGECVPANRKDPAYDKYMEQYTLAHGAWIAGREAIAEQEPVAIVRRCRVDGEIIDGNNDEISVNLPPGTKLYTAEAIAAARLQDQQRIAELEAQIDILLKSRTAGIESEKNRISVRNARIAELEAQLAESGYSACDMATAAAQGFRDGMNPNGVCFPCAPTQPPST